MLIDSVISDAKQGTIFLSCDFKYFFLVSLMKKPKYMMMKYSIFSPGIIGKYNLDNMVAPDRCMYIKIKTGVYGWKQAVVLA